MRKFLPLIFGFAFLSLITSISSGLYASHAMGLDISYQCLGGNQYQFTLNFYRDCDGISAPNSVNINLSSASCGSNFNVNLPLFSGPVEVSPLCASQLSQSTCASPPCTVCLPGVEQYTYQGTFTFTQSCNDWLVSFEECCRNNAITNLSAPATQSLFVSASLDNSGGLCNSSPVFTSSPVPYACADQQFCYNHGAFDPDGDSLSYALVAPLDGPIPGIPIAYSSPALSATNPLFDTTGTVQFDPQTGSLCIIPTDTTPQQVVVIAVQVSEWRNGVVIGTTTRDIQIVVLPCINNQPLLNPDSLTNLSAGAVQLDSNSVEICPGVPFSFDIVAEDPNAFDNVTMVSNSGLVIPASNFVTSGNNPITGTFSWTPTIADVGFHNFTVTIQDDGCPILGSQIFNFDITVVPATATNPDTTYCAAGSPVTLNATGGTVFTWNTISGGPANLSCTNCQATDASPTGTVTLEVVSDLSPTCKNRDTVVVTVVPDFILDAGLDTTICRYGLANINVSATPGGAGFDPYTYSWSPTDSLSSTNSPNITANPIDSTAYVVTVRSDAGCVITDTVNVNIDGVAPQVVVPPADTVCEGAPISLSSVIFQDCGITTFACTGPQNIDTVGIGGFTSSDFGPFVLDPAFQFSNRKQYIFTATELNALGLVGGGRIDSIALDVVTPGDPLVGVEIRMGCVPFDCFPSDTFITGLSLVKNSFTWTPNAGWSGVALDNAYNWDGQSSLLVEICTDAQQAFGNPSTVTTDLYSCNVVNFLNNAFAGGVCSAVTGSPINQRPRFLFRSCEALPPTLTYSWSPPTFLDNSGIPNPTSTPTSTTTYTLNVTDGVCTGSDVVEVVASPVFSISMDNDTTLCLNQPFQTDVTVTPPGTYSFNWTPPSGVNTISSEDPIISAPDTTTYVLSVTSLENCTQTDSFVINIDGIAPIVRITGDDTICPPNAGGPPSSLNTIISQNCGLTSLACTGPVNTDAIEDPIGSSTSLYGPNFIFQGLNTTMRRQYIFTQTELDTMGLQPGMKISGIYLDYTTANDANTDVNIKMGCTTLDSFDASLGFIPGLDVVMTSTAIAPALGYTFFPFTNDYVWDGTSNLVIEICNSIPQTGASATAASDVRFHTVTGNIFRCLYANNFAGTDGCAIPTGDARTFFRPNVQFDFCEAQPTGLTYSWTPSTGLSNTTIPNPTASPSTSVTYNLVVDGGGTCTGGDQFTVAIDSTNFASSLVTPTVGCPSPVYQLNTTVSGPAFSPPLPSCGVNGTPCTQPLYSQQVGTGTDNASTFYSPFFTNVNNSRIQYLYRASDLQAAGISSGTITAIAINITNADSLDLDSMTISMGCTGLGNLSVAAGFQPTTPVLGPVPFNPINGFSLFTLANPFDWDGVNNIIVEFCNTNLLGGNASNVEYTTTTGHNGTLIAFGNGSPGCQLTGPLFLNAGFPNMQFTVCPTPPNPFAYSWAPTTGLDNASIDNPVYTDPDPSTSDTLTVLVTGPNCDILDTVIIPACILPLEYFILEGRQVEDEVHLDWTTLRETNVDHFIVRKKANNGTYGYLGEVQALGNTSGLTQYDLIDPAPVPGANTYQVTAVDLDGSSAESNEVTIIFTESSGLVSLYPNPTKESDGFYVEYFAAQEGQIEVSIVDLFGRTVSQGDYELADGFNKFSYSTNTLAQGNYFVRLKFDGKTEVQKLLIVE